MDSEIVVQFEELKRVRTLIYSLGTCLHEGLLLGRGLIQCCSIRHQMNKLLCT